MIRLYAEKDGRLRFKGKDPEAERLAARAIRAEKRAFEEQLFAENVALLGTVVTTPPGPVFRNDP